MAVPETSEAATSEGGAVSEDCLSAQSARVPQLLHRNEERLASAAFGATAVQRSCEVAAN